MLIWFHSALQELVDNSNSYRYWATEALSDDWTHCYGTMAFFHISENEDEDEDKAPYLPHMAVAVCDSIRQSSETLTSEVAAALQMLIYRLHIGDFVDHHTLPVSGPTQQLAAASSSDSLGSRLLFPTRHVRACHADALG